MSVKIGLEIFIRLELNLQIAFGKSHDIKFLDPWEWEVFLFFMSSLVYFFKVLSFDVEDFHFLGKM